MDLPENTLLPMFVYGVFQPGDLGFLRVKDYVTRVDAGRVSGKLMVRDGLPLLDLAGGARVDGAVLHFYPRPQVARTIGSSNWKPTNSTTGALSLLVPSSINPPRRTL